MVLNGDPPGVMSIIDPCNCRFVNIFLYNDCTLNRFKKNSKKIFKIEHVVKKIFNDTWLYFKTKYFYI